MTASEPDEPVVVATFGQRYEAEMALGLLEDAGIPGFVQADDSRAQVPPMQGARIFVAPENEVAAREVLEGEAEIPTAPSRAPARRLDEAGGRRFAYGLAALVVGVALVVIDLVESGLVGTAPDVGPLGWVGIGLAAWGGVSVARSSIG